MRRELSILQKIRKHLSRIKHFAKNAPPEKQFSNKKEVIGKPERPKRHQFWAACPRTHISTKYPQDFIFHFLFYDDINLAHIKTGLAVGVGVGGGSG